MVVLVGEGDEPGVGGHRRQGPLEVAVDADVRSLLHLEAGIVADDLGDRREGLRARAVVADQAHPVAVRLLAERLDLAPQETRRRVEGRHADRDARVAAERASAKTVAVRLPHARARQQPQRPDRLAGAATSGEPCPHLQRHLARAIDTAQLDQPPEAAAVGALAPGARKPCRDVGPRHARGQHRLALAVDMDA